MEAYIVKVKGNVKARYAVNLTGVTSYEAFKAKIEEALTELKASNPEASFKVAAIFSLEA